MDRLLDVAKMLPKELRSKVVFGRVGDMSERSLRRFLPWERSFQDRICTSDLSNMFIFMGI